MGQIKRTDWLPVGTDPRGGEQLRQGVDSQSESEGDDADDAFSAEKSDCNGRDSDMDPTCSARWLASGSAGAGDDAQGLF